MDIQAAKLDLVEKILQIGKADLIDKLNQILDKELVVGYTADGKPLTKEEYNSRLERAEEEAKYGRVTSANDLKKEIESWKK